MSLASMEPGADVARTPPTIGEMQLSPGLVAATMPQRQGVIEHSVDAQPFAVLIYTRPERILREPPARGVTAHRIPARSVSFLPAGLPSRWLYASPLVEQGQTPRVLHLRFTSAFARALELAPNQFLFDPAPALDLRVKGLARQMDLALRAYRSDSPLGRIALQSAAFAAAERFFGGAGQPCLASTLTIRRRRALLDYVESAPLMELSISGMADAIGLSASHFYRVFKAWSGQTPLRWALERRAIRQRQDA